MTKKPNLAQIEQLMRNLIIPFYAIGRDITIPDTTRRRESDAEHSWSLAVTACTLAPLVDPELNIGLVAQFALVHDLPEVYATDISVWDTADKLANKHGNELAARKRLIKEYAHMPWISDTIEKYERQDTQEAKFVFALDKLLPLLIRKIDKGKAYVEMKLTKERFIVGLSPSRSKAQSHQAVGEYFEELWAIFDSHPEYFYQPEL